MRITRAKVAALALLGVLSLAGPAAAGKDSLSLSESGGARFPDRSFVLTLPSGTFLESEDIEVTENGDRVSNVAVVPASEAGKKTFGVVLVIDASNSMKGDPIENAVEAARAFAARRNVNQPVAIVTFNSTATVLLPFTTDQTTIETALASAPPLAFGTHIYDAVDTASSLLEDAKIVPGSIVVLSDGADTGSRTTLAEIGALSEKTHARIFSVGLKSRVFDPRPLRRLADDAGGQYAEAASSGDLMEIYDQLGAQLASEYLLRYRSVAGPSTRMDVVVRIHGVRGTAAAQYVTPALPTVPKPPFQRPFSEVFWSSPLAMLIISLLSAGLIALGFVAILGARRPTLRKRMSEFVSVAVPGQTRDVRTERVFAGAEKSLARTRWWTRFKLDLEIAKIRISAIQIVLWTLVGTLFVVWLLYVIGGVLFGILGLAIPLVVRAVVKSKVARVRKQFSDQLPDNLQVLASALRAGYSLVGALSVVVDDAPEPAGGEFRRVIADEQLGVPLENALTAVARRMDNRDLEQVALVASLQRETGGNTAEVLDRVSETIRERFELRRMVKTLTAQGRMSRWVVSFLPVLLLVLISLLNPAYMAPLYTNPAGRLLLVVAAVLVVAGSLVIKRIVDIKV